MRASRSYALVARLGLRTFVYMKPSAQSAEVPLVFFYSFCSALAEASVKQGSKLFALSHLSAALVALRTPLRNEKRRQKTQQLKNISLVFFPDVSMGPRDLC